MIFYVSQPVHLNLILDQFRTGLVDVYAFMAVYYEDCCIGSQILTLRPT